MRATVRKWGNSAAVRLPSALMDAACIEVDTEVEIRVDAGRIVIEPVRPPFDLGSLIGAITPDNLHGVVDDGKPVGRELL